MEIHDLPFDITEWDDVESVTHDGQSGTAEWRTKHFGDIRVRIVEYSAGYLADHWCSKGHILYCLSGELTTQLDDGRVYVLTAGMSYQVADNSEAHRSSTSTGAKLFIVD